MKKVFIAALLVCATLSSCENLNDGTSLKTSGSKPNSNFDPQFLFEADGIKVYRFTDNCRDIYFTNTNGEISSRHNEGKVTVEDQTICSKQ